MARREFIAVYIMVSRRNGTLYLGVTSDIPRRVHEHREGLIEGFSRKRGCKLLVWFEQHEEVGRAIDREKELKKWRRALKLELIEKINPQWRDLMMTSAISRRRASSRSAGHAPALRLQIGVNAIALGLCVWLVR